MASTSPNATTATKASIRAVSWSTGTIGVAGPLPVHDRIDRGRRAQGGDRRQGDRLNRGLGPGVPGDVVKQAQQRRQRAARRS